MKKSTALLVSASVLLSLMPVSFASAANSNFTDISSYDYYYNEASALSELNILSGYPDGSFKGTRSVTRAEMAAIACRMLGKEASANAQKGDTEFFDVNEDHWASGYVNTAVSEGIIVGDGNGYFRPEDEVKYEEAIKIVVCAAGYGDGVEVYKNDWSAGYLRVADKYKITSNLEGSKGNASKRSDVAVMVYNGLTAELSAPEISLNSGTYTGVKNVAIRSSNKDAQIYYTLDGSTPTYQSNKYVRPITISKDTTLCAAVIKDKVLSSKVASEDYVIGVKKITGGASIVSSYNVSFNLNYAGAANAPETQTVQYGKYAEKPEDPERDNHQFLGWFTTTDADTPENSFSFNDTQIKRATTLYAHWANTTLDSDNDGINDDLEAHYGTDKDKADTDGDGLTDYQEIFDLGTNPLKADSDGNGVSDYDEDADGDGLSNGYEYSIGSNPQFKDTDGDTLSDYDEVHTYKTSPINDDTDEDGASDDWEINNGFDPLAKNDTFNIKATSGTLSAENILIASVEGALPGKHINGLEVKHIASDAVESKFPVFKSSKFTFSTQSDIDSAVITFEYEKGKYAEDPDFNPGIYYTNPITGEAAELPTQTVEDGKITATIKLSSGTTTLYLANKVNSKETKKDEEPENSQQTENELPPAENVKKEPATLEGLGELDAIID